MSFLETILDFLSFLTAPRPDRSDRKHISIVNMVSLFALIFISNIVLLGMIVQVLGIEQLDHKLDDVLLEKGQFFIIMAAVVGAPLMEEFLFRYPLRYHKATFFLLSMSVIYIMIESFNLNIHVMLNLIIVLFATGLLTLVVMDRAQEWWKKVYVRQFPFIFYYIVALFAFLHIYNFDVNTINWYYAPLMVVPQFILGIYLGYVRLRNNIWSSILIHAINNIIPMILFLTFGSK